MPAWLIPALIAAATSVGSSVLHDKAADKVAKEQRLREMLELGRQDEMRGRAQKSFADLLATQNKEAQLADQANENQKLERIYVDAVDPRRFSELLPGQGDASAAVMTDIINEAAQGTARGRQQGRARAALEGYGRTGLNNDVRFQNTHQNLNDIAGESRGSAAILPLELNAAQNKGASLRGWANALSAASSIAGSVASGSLFKTAMTPGPFGGESSILNIGNKAITPSLDVFKVGPAPGIYGPAIQQSSWGQLLRGG